MKVIYNYDIHVVIFSTYYWYCIATMKRNIKSAKWLSQLIRSFFIITFVWSLLYSW